MADTFKIQLSLLFLFLYLSTLSHSLPTDTILHAGEVLSNSGYLSMYLTLRLVSSSLIPNSPSLTIFSPSDSAFSRSGQPSLSLLQYHFSPLLFTPRSLRALNLGSKIPTLLLNHSLLVTSSQESVYINGVRIDEKPIYDDGSLIIFGIDEFFDLGNEVTGKDGVERSDTGCSVKRFEGYKYSFREAIGFLRSNKYSIMAMFLDLQLMGFKEETMLTMFAPADEVMSDFLGKLNEYSSIFFRHVVPCKISWNELIDTDEGSVIETYLEGFGIRIARAGDILMLNEVPITFPDMYRNEWLVIHGLRGMFEDSKTLPGDAVSWSEMDSSSNEESVSSDDGF